MIWTKQRFESFEEYLSYEDDTDNLYELFNGELIAVPPESGFNVDIVGFLFVRFALMLGHQRVRAHNLELEVRGEPRNRFPGFTVLREEHGQQLARRNTIRLFMAPPLLVVEVVSPGELQRDRDYIAKRMQYQDRGVPEYWIIDPDAETVLVLQLTGATYAEVGSFAGDDRIPSPQFPELDLTVKQLLAAGHAGT